MVKRPAACKKPAMVRKVRRPAAYKKPAGKVKRPAACKKAARTASARKRPALVAVNLQPSTCVSRRRTTTMSDSDMESSASSFDPVLSAPKGPPPPTPVLFTGGPAVARPPSTPLGPAVGMPPSTPLGSVGMPPSTPLGSVSWPPFTPLGPSGPPPPTPAGRAYPPVPSWNAGHYGDRVWCHWGLGRQRKRHQQLQSGGLRRQ